MQRSAGVLISLALLASLGCPAMFTDPMGRREALRMTQRDYTNMIRWGQIERASELVDPTQRDEFLRFVPAFESIRITDFDISKPRWSEDPEAPETVSYTVVYHGYSLTSLVERTTREKQEWYREDGSNSWLVRPGIAEIAGAFAVSGR